jgi:hypothetical protein
MSGLRIEIAPALLSRYVEYNPETGILTWCSNFNVQRRLRGLEAGRSVVQGYRKVMINRVEYFVHRIAFAMMTGAWPEHEIDHINRVKDDNRWANLREATHAENMRNHPGKCGRRSRYKGVRKSHNCDRYEARIVFDGVNHFLGMFETEGAAGEAYAAAAKRLHGDFALPASLVRESDCEVAA